MIKDLIINLIAIAFVMGSIGSSYGIEKQKDVEALLQKASQCYDQRDQVNMAEQAVEVYKKIIESDPTNYEAHWKLARALCWIGNHAEDKTLALQILAEGETIGKKVIEIKHEGRDGLYWYGVCLGRAAEKRGVLNSLFAIDPMNNTMCKILEQDAEDGFVHHFLSVLYRKAPGWPLSIGDKNKSLYHAELAIKYEPKSTITYLGYAYALQVLGKHDEAKKNFEKVLSMQGTDDMQPETKEDKLEAKKVLQAL